MKYDKYSWWYGDSIDFDQGVRLLQAVGKEGAYLVRISSTRKYYNLAVLRRAGCSLIVNHYAIFQTPGGRFHLEGDNFYAPSLPELIEHHQKCSDHLQLLLRYTPTDAVKHTVATVQRGLANTGSRNNARRGSFDQLVHKWQIDLRELQFDRKLGQGAFGVVHKAKLRGTVDVAVKMMIRGSMSEELFIKEAHTMIALKHPHIVRLCGICTNQRPIFIVTEYMSHGCLIIYLVKYKTALLKNIRALRSICAQVASGMAYLESKNFIHRDLASRNCLVGDKGEVKVTDFGMSRFMNNTSYKGSEQSAVPVRSIPPEVIKSRLFSSKSDVWAFGLLMWEVFTCGDAPFGSLGHGEVLEKVKDGWILDKPRAATEIDYKLMKSCWAYSPNNRPSFAVLEQSLRSLCV